MLRRLQSFFFVNSSVRQTIAKNTFWLGFGTIGSRIFRAILIVLAARMLGTESYGVFSYVLSISAFLVIFSDIGIAGVLTREAAKRPEKIEAYLSTAFVLRSILLVPVVLIMLFVVPRISTMPEANPLIPFITLLLIFDNIRNFAFSVTRAQNRMELEGVFTLVTDIAITGIGTLLLFSDPSPLMLAIAYAAGSGVGTIGILLVLKKYARSIVTHFSPALVKPILTSAWPFAIVGVLSGFMINVDTIIVGLLRPTSELGLYAAAQRPIQLLYVIPALLTSSIFPIMSRFVHENAIPRVRTLLERSMAMNFALVFPVVAGGLLVGEQLMLLLFGTPYATATLTFQLLLFTLLLTVPAGILANTIFIYDRQKIFIISGFLGAVGNVVFDLILIPRYGIEGSVIATIVAQILSTGLLWAATQRLVSFQILRHLRKITIATLIMGCITYALSLTTLPVLVVVGLSAIVYGLTLVALREPLIREVRALTHA